jgi:hypothetical protein
VSPTPEAFSPRPNDAKHTFGQVNHPPEGNVNDLISDLNIDNKPIEETVQSHTKKIAELQTNGRLYHKEIAELKSLLLLSSEVVKIKANVQSEILQFRSEILQLRNGINEVNTSTNNHLNVVEHHRSSPIVNYQEPPYYNHMFFLGDVKETNQFCFFMRNCFERLTENFSTDKYRILWTAGYF